MEITITSWNCQGDSLETISQSAGSIICPHDLNIVLIQEAGSMGSMAGQITDVPIAGNPYKAYFVEQKDAVGKRCTTGVMVSAQLWDPGVTVMDKSEIESVRRPLVFCMINLGGTLLYVSTLHATARRKISKEEVNLICNLWHRTCHSTNNGWILMGDMNCDAGKLDIRHGHIIAPDEPTQKSGGILDYAIVSPGLVTKLASFGRNSKIWVDSYYRDSDHLTVKIRLVL